MGASFGEEVFGLNLLLETHHSLIQVRYAAGEYEVVGKVLDSQGEPGAAIIARGDLVEVTRFVNGYLLGLSHGLRGLAH